MSSAKSKYITPLKKAKGLGSAQDGTHHWWMQRVTAIANLALVSFFVCNALALIGKEHHEVLLFFATPFHAVMMALFIISSFYHAALGLQVVIEDYVHTEGKKIALLLFVKLGLFALGAASVLAIAKMHFAV